MIKIIGYVYFFVVFYGGETDPDGLFTGTFFNHVPYFKRLFNIRVSEE